MEWVTILTLSVPPFFLYFGIGLFFTLEKWSRLTALDQRSYVKDRLGNRLISFYPVEIDEHAKYLITFRNPWILYKNIKIKSHQ